MGRNTSTRESSARHTCVRLLEAAGIEVGGREPWDIQVHDERLWERALVERELAFGEAYMDGWWDAQRPDQLLARIVDANVEDAIRPSPRLVATVLRAKLAHRQTVSGSRRNAQHHYDIGDDLYERMLDKRMIYSCAYFADQPSDDQPSAGDSISAGFGAGAGADGLDEAQEAKLDLICRKLHLEPGMQVLDIGCGWGGFAHFAAERYGAGVVGISPAAHQVTRAQARCEGMNVEIRQQDYREVTGHFDRIVSIGMMEHVGASHHGEFITTCNRLLAPGGLMLHHFIGALETKTTTDPWIEKYVFPGGLLPSVVQFARACEDQLVIEDVHNFGPDYDRTLMSWLSRIESSWDEIPRYDERFRRMWRYYLCASAAGFRARRLQLWQFVVRRTGHAPPYTPVR